MNKRHSAIGRLENIGGNLVKVRRSQYFRTGGATVDQMFYDAAKESCAIWVVELKNDTTSNRRGRQSAARTEDETTARDYEPVDKVPFPNSSRMIRDRSVQFLKANET